MHPCEHPPRARRGLRLARFVTALAAFATTSFGLHSLAGQHGWHSHFGPGAHQAWQHPGWGQPCEDKALSAQAPQA